MDNELVMLSSWDAETRFLAEAIERQAADGRHLEILEAGCGKAWPLDLDGVSFRLTGVDLDDTALEMRIEQGDLGCAIHGDLRTVELPDREFDVVYNSFVLEHIDGAEQVLDNFVRWSRPGAVLVLRFPDRDSVFGFITRVTPHWFHVLYKRWIVGNKNAGKPGHEPYPTVYDPVVSRRGFHDYCASRGLRIREERGFPVGQAGSGIKLKAAVAVAKAFGALTFGRLPSGHMWLTYVVERPAEAGPPATSS